MAKLLINKRKDLMKEDKLLILENIKKAIIIQDKKEKKTR